MTLEGIETFWQDSGLDPVPELCQQFACNKPVQTWCPLCRAYLCDDHDELYPRRRHDCLRGAAET